MSTQPQNYIYSVLFLVIFVVIVLVGLRLTKDDADKVNMKPVDIFSAVEKDSIPVPRLDSLKQEEKPLSVSAKAISLEQSDAEEDNPMGFIRFDDYSTNNNGLHLFFSKLLNQKALGRPVRIAFFGDSFIEGDILSGDLRRLFQENFGGRGVGMMPVTSQVNNFRKTVVHQFSAWNTHSFNSNFDKSKLGINGNVYIPNKNAWVYYQGVDNNLLDTCSRISVFYSLPDGETKIYYKKNKGVSYYEKLPKAENVGCVNIDGSCGNIQISFPQMSQLHIYGVSMEDTTGVILDNYSLRGFSGTGLHRLSKEKLSCFNEILQYDLIILGFGLNVAEANRTEYKSYEKEMIQTIDHLKSSFPNASVLLIGVPDRCHKINGGYETMPGILSMIEYQKNICQKSEIVFWNLFEAMGGKNSMPLFVNSNPPKASKDYTHLTFAGGEYLGNLLYETFMYEKEIYEKRFIQAMVK